MTLVRSAMCRAVAALAPVLAVATAVEAQHTTVQAVPTAFVHVSVVPMDSVRVLRDQTVVVRGSQIVALGPSARVAVPAGAVRIDGRGKFLIPGLADMHAHLMLPFLRLMDTTFERRLSLSDRVLLQEQQLFLWLAHGLTTVRNLDHEQSTFGRDLRGEQLLQLRALAAAGKILSPRIYTSGYIAGRLTRADTQAPLHLAEVAEAVRTYKAAGFDFIKVHPITLGWDAPSSVFDSLAAAARRAGLPLVGHTVVPLEQALQTYKSIEHLSGYVDDWGYRPVLTDSMLRQPNNQTLADPIRELAVATQRAGVWNCPTFYNEILNLDVSNAPWVLWGHQHVIKALQDAGAGLLAGSDRLQMPSPEFMKLMIIPDPKLRVANLRAAGITRGQALLQLLHGDPGATHQELRAFVERAGLTPYQALATATRNVAAYFGTLDSAGTIAVGKRADLVLLAGNPLADIRQTERIAGVMLGGRWLDQATLARRTAAIRRSLEQRCIGGAGAGAAQWPCPLAEQREWIDSLEWETH